MKLKEALSSWCSSHTFTDFAPRENIFFIPLYPLSRSYSVGGFNWRRSRSPSTISNTASNQSLRKGSKGGLWVKNTLGEMEKIEEDFCKIYMHKWSLHYSHSKRKDCIQILNYELRASRVWDWLDGCINLSRSSCLSHTYFHCLSLSLSLFQTLAPTMWSHWRPSTTWVRGFLCMRAPSPDRSRVRFTHKSPPRSPETNVWSL